MMFVMPKKLIFLTVITMMLPCVYIFNILIEERAAGREQLLLTKELLKQTKLNNQVSTNKHKLKKSINVDSRPQTDTDIDEEDEREGRRAKRKKKRMKKKERKNKNRQGQDGHEFRIHDGKYIPGMENAIILDEESRRIKNRSEKKKKKQENKADVVDSVHGNVKETNEKIKQTDNQWKTDNSVVSDVELNVPAAESYIYKPAIAPKQRTLKKYIAKKCHEMGLEGKMVLPAVPLFNEKHKLLYISNPKCGSTSFKKFMRRLAGDTTPYDSMKDVHKEDMNIKIIKNLYNESIEVQEKVFRDYYKVTFVRNPLVRLVSGYRNKIIRAQYTTMIQRIIIKHYGVEAAKSWLPRHKYRPSFEQFVDHILTTEDIKNSHWAPYCDKIQLCGFNYDMIGQLETASQQIDLLKKKLNTLEDIEFPPSRTESHQDGYSSEQLTFLAYANLTKPQLKSIYDLYKNEIKLLGYSTLTDENFPYIKLATIIDNTNTISNSVNAEEEIDNVLPNDQVLLPIGHDDDADEAVIPADTDNELSPDVQLQDSNLPPMNEYDHDDGPMPMD